MAVAVLLALLAFFGLGARLFRGYQLQATDNLYPAASTDGRIVVVGIDRKSIDDIGEPWPWSRTLHARLARQIARAKPAMIVYDVVFQPPKSDDVELARVFRTTRVVGAAQLDLERGRRLFVGTGAGGASEIVRAAADVGFANITPDPADGVTRSLPLVVEDPSGELLPALSLAALRTVEQLDGALIVRPDGVEIAGRFVPAADYALFNVNYAEGLGPTPTRSGYLSAIDVIQGKVAANRLAGKIVFIGATDPTLGDTRITPVAKTGGMPGVLVQANALNTMLTRSYIKPGSRFTTVGLVFLLALIAGVVTAVAPIAVAVVVSLLLGMGYVLLAVMRFDSGTAMDLIYPPAALTISFVLTLAIRYMSELRERRRVSSLFSQYVPDSVAKQLLDRGLVEEALREKVTTVTVFFCDLRGFTAMSTRLSPEQLRALIDVYYEEVTGIIFDHGGTLLLYVGDEIFAIFGAPLPDADSPRRALACALDVQAAAARVNERLEADGLPAIAYGIGLHTGPVVSAHVGARFKQFTVLGDTVNCGARLCSIAPPGGVVVSGDLYALLDDPPPAEALPPIELKGVGRDLKPYRVTSMPQPPARVS